MLGSVTRRLALGASALPALLTFSKDAQAADRLDLSRPENLESMIVKIRGSLSAEMFMGYVLGQYYGYSEGRMTPLYGLLAGTFTRFRKAADGSREGISFELAYFTEFGTNNVLEEFRNPYTGKMVKVPKFSTKPAPFKITAKGIQFKSENPDLKIYNRFLKPTIDADWVWITEENRNEFDATSTKPAFMYNEIVTMLAKRSDVENPTIACAPTTIAYQSEVTWRPWLEMGDTPGHLVGNATGRKINRLDAFPEAYLDISRKSYPQIFENLEGYLDSGWK